MDQSTRVYDGKAITSRQEQVMKLSYLDMTQKAIAIELGNRHRTVQTHMKTIHQVLGVQTVTGMHRWMETHMFRNYPHQRIIAIIEWQRKRW